MRLSARETLTVHGYVLQFRLYLESFARNWPVRSSQTVSISMFLLVRYCKIKKRVNNSKAANVRDDSQVRCEDMIEV